MTVSKLSGFGLSRIDHPDLAAIRSEFTKSTNRIGDGVRMSVRHDRIAAKEQQ